MHAQLRWVGVMIVGWLGLGAAAALAYPGPGGRGGGPGRGPNAAAGANQSGSGQNCPNQNGSNQSGASQNGSSTSGSSTSGSSQTGTSQNGSSQSGLSQYGMVGRITAISATSITIVMRPPRGKGQRNGASSARSGSSATTGSGAGGASAQPSSQTFQLDGNTQFQMVGDKGVKTAQLSVLTVGKLVGVQTSSGAATVISLLLPSRHKKPTSNN